MENFDLNSCGIQEMTTMQQENVNGGWLITWVEICLACQPICAEMYANGQMPMGLGHASR